MVNAGREIWIEREGGVEHVGVLAHQWLMPDLRMVPEYAS
jgi:hypothetical protein